MAPVPSEECDPDWSELVTAMRTGDPAFLSVVLLQRASGKTWEELVTDLGLELDKERGSQSV